MRSYLKPRFLCCLHKSRQNAILFFVTALYLQSGFLYDIVLLSGGNVGFAARRIRERREKMSEYKNLYFPLFYEAIENAEPISDENFGRIIRSVSRIIRGESVTGELSSELQTICNMIVSSAHRVFEGSQSQNTPKVWNKKPEKKLDSDKELWVSAAFEKALERTYGRTRGNEN